MPQTNEEISELIIKFLEDSLNEAEAARLELWLAQNPNNRQFFETAIREDSISAGVTRMMDFDEEAGWQNIARKVNTSAVRRIKWNRYLSVAAVITAFIAGTYLFFFHSPSVQKPAQVIVDNKTRIDDKEPGKDGAVLILPTGEEVSLDNIVDGNVATQQGAALVKRGASLVWEKTNATAIDAAINQVVTSRGRQFQMTLSDGTKVWLNSASSMKFPAIFSGAERVVEITGEAYFEVAKMTGIPFKVKVGEMEVKVLGTHFNIKAFDDEEKISTTLIEGKVDVKGPKGSLLLSPGQQANLTRNNRSLTLDSGVDAEKVIAWKSGFFEFDDTGLPDIMRQISRWYDVDIVYESKPTHEKFGGGISKQLPLKQVLHMLEMNGVKFRLEENTLYVKP